MRNAQVLRRNHMRIISFFLDLLFPPKCLNCDSTAPSGAALCAVCQEQMATYTTCTSFSLNLQQDITLRCLTPMPYVGIYRNNLIGFKFKGNTADGRRFAQLMASHKDLSGECFDLIAHVPMHRAAESQRGYNQSKLLARAVSKIIQVPTANCLLKQQVNQAQRRLSRKARELNVSGVFLASPIVADKRVLLIDDILTTGATVKACAEALYAAGCKSVTAVCAAKTMRMDNDAEEVKNERLVSENYSVDWAKRS